jgi:hypothetical protein
MKSCLKTRSFQGEDCQAQETAADSSPSNQLIHRLICVRPKEIFFQDDEYDDEVDGHFSKFAHNHTKRARISSCAPFMEENRISSSKRLRWGTMQEIHGSE